MLRGARELAHTRRAAETTLGCGSGIQSKDIFATHQKTHQNRIGTGSSKGFVPRTTAYGFRAQEGARTAAVDPGRPAHTSALRLEWPLCSAEALARLSVHVPDNFEGTSDEAGGPFTGFGVAVGVADVRGAVHRLTIVANFSRWFGVEQATGAELADVGAGNADPRARG